MNGYFGIGIYKGKDSNNIGTLWRSAYLFGADFIFTIEHRYKKQRTDTQKTPRHIPLFQFDSFEEFKKSIPSEADLVCVELSEKSKPLSEFYHPKQSIYLLGAEDFGIPKEIMEGNQKVKIEQYKEQSMNVAVSGSIIMYDRFIKSHSNRNVKVEKGVK